MTGDRDDLRKRLDALDAGVDDAEPLIVVPDGDDGHVDKQGDPIRGESPGRIVIPSEVTDEWVGDWGPQ